MQKRHWTNLTEQEKETFGGGCGPGNGLLGKWVPELYFHADCRQHDFYYAEGGDLFDKIEADLMFYAHMVKSINAVCTVWYKKTTLFLVATVYFVAVAIFGAFAFSWK